MPQPREGGHRPGQEAGTAGLQRPLLLRRAWRALTPTPWAGPDWRWGNQDAYGPGEITDLNPDRSNPNWVTVRWASGLKNNYRVGVDGEFDLVTPDPAVGYSVDVVQAVSGKLGRSIGLVHTVRGSGRHSCGIQGTGDL